MVQTSATPPTSPKSKADLPPIVEDLVKRARREEACGGAPGGVYGSSIDFAAAAVDFAAVEAGYVPADPRGDTKVSAC